MSEAQHSLAALIRLLDITAANFAAAQQRMAPDVDGEALSREIGRRIFEVLDYSSPARKASSLVAISCVLGSLLEDMAVPPGGERESQN